MGLTFGGIPPHTRTTKGSFSQALLSPSALRGDKAAVPMKLRHGLC